MSSIEMDNVPTAITTDTDALDPENSERQYHRNPYTGLQREIWRPGDEDGAQDTEYFERGQVLPLQQRWRIFQSDIGEISYKEGNLNLPPKFVFLDDRAVFEVLNSDIPKAKIQAWWPHDFGGQGKVRKIRPHIGRPAIKDDEAEGDARFHSFQLVGKGGLYYFSGQKDYEPVKYKLKPKSQPTEEELSRKRKAEELLQESDEEEESRFRHGHNQYTPREKMVKHGAPSMTKKPPKVHNLPALPRASSVMRSTNSPFYIEKRLYGGIGQQARDAVANSASNGAIDHTGQPKLRGPSRLQNFAIPDDQDDLDEEDEFEQGTVAPAGPIDVPRQMGYIERRDVVQRVKTQVINTVQTQEDVQRLATELAEEKVKVGQQAKEIDKLKLLLEGAEAKVEHLESSGEGDREKVAELEIVLGDKENEIENLKAEVLREKQQKWQREIEIDEHKETIRSLQTARRS